MSDAGYETEDYEAGDVNTIDAGYEAGDVNTITEPGEQADEDAVEPANRAEGGVPSAVLDYLARALADEPEAVVVHTGPRRGGVRLQLHVAPSDMGRVIGRRGRTAQAIRTVVGVAGARDGVQTSVDIADD